MKFLILLVLFITACSSVKEQDQVRTEDGFDTDSVDKFLAVLSEEYMKRSIEFEKEGYIAESKIFREKSKEAQQRDATHYNERTFVLSKTLMDEAELAKLFFEKLKGNVIIFDLFPESLARMQTYYDCMIVEFREATSRKITRTKCTEQFDNMQKAFQRTGFSKNIKYVSEAKNRETFVIYFALGSAKIEQEFYGIIYNVAKKAKTKKDYKVRVVGLADKTGNRKINEKISAERADEVMKALVKAGIDKNKIYTESLADDFSLVETKSAEKFNRRVIIDLID